MKKLYVSNGINIQTKKKRAGEKKMKITNENSWRIWLRVDPHANESYIASGFNLFCCQCGVNPIPFFYYVDNVVYFPSIIDRSCLIYVEYL